MNFKLVALLAAVAPIATIVTANNLRGDALKNEDHRELQYSGYRESLGVCTGAVCGFWGDPHMVTCDGLYYDCQGIGIFTVMKNHMYNIQGNFVDIGDMEHSLVRSWGLTQGASITNDIMIDYLQDEDDSVPVMQFGFGDLKNWVGEAPKEEGCEAWTMFSPVNMPGQGRSVAVNAEACRDRCEGTDGCKQFTWWADEGCHLNNGTEKKRSTPRSWSRSLLGTLDSKCGKREEKDILLEGEDQTKKHGTIGPKCPLLMYVDGEMVDLSHINIATKHAFLWGKRDDDHFVELVGDHIRVVHKTATGDFSEIGLTVKGVGPGELWSCHWNFNVCLNSKQAQRFAVDEPGIGLLGSPDSNKSNDWMDKDGNILDTITLTHKGTIDYCVNNWCVSQEESLMTYHGDTTYEDHKCEAEEYVDYKDDNEKCVLDADQIDLACKAMPPLLKIGCQVDCCFGGCKQMEETVEEIEEIVDLTKLNADPPNDNSDFGFKLITEEAEECVISEKTDTSSTKCPGSEVVKLLKTTGGEPLPEDSGDLFYDIAFDEQNNLVEFKVNNPFEASAKVFVKRDKKAIAGFLDPICDGEQLTAKGCDDDYLVQVACRDYDGIAPFALINVYFASVAVSPLNEQATIDKCCQPEEFTPAVGIVEYTFEVQCGCDESLQSPGMSLQSIGN